MIITYAPAGLEEFFFEVGVPFDGEYPPPPSEEEIQNLMSAAPRYGIEILIP